MISPETTATFEKLTTMVKRAAQARSKDIRLDMVDATLIVAEIANVMSRLAVYENATVKDTTTLNVKMDGGNF